MRLLALAVLLFGAAAANATADRPLGIIYPKSRSLWGDERAIEYSAWNAHSNVTVRAPGDRDRRFSGDRRPIRPRSR